VGQAFIRSGRRTGGAEDTRPARPTDPTQGTRPVDPRVRPAERGASTIILAVDPGLPTVPAAVWVAGAPGVDVAGQGVEDAG
jgi:hypothetical protein